MNKSLIGLAVVVLCLSLGGPALAAPLTAEEVQAKFATREAVVAFYQSEIFEYAKSQPNVVNNLRAVLAVQKFGDFIERCPLASGHCGNMDLEPFYATLTHHSRELAVDTFWKRLAKPDSSDSERMAASLSVLATAAAEVAYDIQKEVMGKLSEPPFIYVAAVNVSRSLEMTIGEYLLALSTDDAYEKLLPDGYYNMIPMLINARFEAGEPKE